MMEENTQVEVSNEVVQETPVRVKRPYVRKTTLEKKKTTAPRRTTVRKPRVAKVVPTTDEAVIEVKKPRGRPAKVAVPVEEVVPAPAEKDTVVVIEEFNDEEAAKQIKRNLKKLKKISLKLKEQDKKAEKKKKEKAKKEKAKKKLKEKKAKKKAADKKKKEKKKSKKK